MIDPRRFKLAKIVLAAVLLAVALAFLVGVVGGGFGKRRAGWPTQAAHLASNHWPAGIS